MRNDTPERKTKEMDELAAKIKKYPVTAIVNLENLPSKQLLQIKYSLAGQAKITMAKKSAITRALKKAKREGLLEYVIGQPALVLTEENPFKLSKKLRASRTKAAAKVGSILTSDIVIPAGETSFSPGPIVGELGQAGIKAAIDKGKVVIKQDATVAKAGEPLTRKQVDILAKFGIEPLEIGLDLVAAFEDNLVYKQDVLSISTERVLGQMQDAYRGAFNLAFNVSYPTKKNIEMFVQKAFREAKGLAIEAGYLCSATVKDLLAKASREADSVKANLKDAPAAAATEEKKEETEEKKEEAAEEKPAEEKKEEATEEKKEEAPKEDAKPEEDAPKEEPKVEEAPKEEKAPEEKKEE